MDWTWGPPDTWDETRQFLEGIERSLPEKPRAMVVISGHWEEAAFTAGAAQHPRMIYDYSGFPPHTYKLTWPALGNPALAQRIARRLAEAGLPSALSPDRGYDHGVFVPLKVAFPNADIPVVTLSLAASPDGSFDVGKHIAAGRALASLRDEGVLIVGSGMSFHNLGSYLRPGTLEVSQAFDNWLTDAVEQPAPARDARLARWHEAPQARFSHPREEHLAPLFVVAGAGGNAPGQHVFSGQPMGAAISAYRFDG
jgi:aromatic ring-opening dioxygenase catalytic subunit (LigB family)